MIEKAWHNQEFLLIGFTRFWFIAATIVFIGYTLLWYWIGRGVTVKWFKKAYWKWLWWIELIRKY